MTLEQFLGAVERSSAEWRLQSGKLVRDQYGQCPIERVYMDAVGWGRQEGYLSAASLLGLEDGLVGIIVPAADGAKPPAGWPGAEEKCTRAYMTVRELRTRLLAACGLGEQAPPAVKVVMAPVAVAPEPERELVEV